MNEYELKAAMQIVTEKNITAKQLKDFSEEYALVKLVKIGMFSTIVSLTALLWGCPVYNVWSQGLAGKAELRRAEQNRMIAVEEAKAKLESAELLNQAEVKRAEGLAQATELVVDSFGGPGEYLRYLWIQSLEENNADIIYVPTEAGLPILEASKQIPNESQ